MTTLYRLALLLAIVGALNWGLVGLFQWDLVAALFGGQDAAFSRVVYSLVGLAGLLLIFTGFGAERAVGHHGTAAPHPR
jgi:uncharacterized membrane protein YuzA (DUF378 family)